ncbi:MAG: PilZ domain-containing protein [Planctomycetota bacterium]
MKLVSLKNPKPKKSASPFQVDARGRGLSVKQAALVEPAALLASPADPTQALADRESFEKVVAATLAKDLAQLTLGFAMAEECANALETLNLGRCSETPDPYRMVWVASEGREPLRGVVIPGRSGEVAVFCPVKGDAPTTIGTEIDLSYRDSKSDLTYDLQLLDTVCLADARVLHLGRRQDPETGHGRVTARHEVEIVGFVRRTDAVDGPATPMPCRIVDISFGGLRLTCTTRLEKGIQIQLDVFLDDGIAEPLSVACEVRWVEMVPEGHQIGLHFGELPEEQSKRLEQAIGLIRAT